MQLVAYGAQDIYLTGNPQITFFKVVYRRYTNFAIEAIEQTVNGNAQFGKKFSVTIARNGDLLSRIYLEIDWGAKIVAAVQQGLLTGDGAALNGWFSNIIKYVELEIGGQCIDKQYGEWMDIWCDLTHDLDKKLMLTEITLGSVLTTAATAGGSGTSDLCYEKTYLPLQFWFCRNPGLALPLIALQYHEVKLNVQMANLCQTTCIPNLICNLCVYADYVFLDTDERRRFAQVSHEYLIEQVQYSNSISIGDSECNITTELRFNHPVKELMWVIERKGSGGCSVCPQSFACAKTCLLQLNGHDRFKKRDGAYFRNVQRYEHHSGVSLGSVTNILNIANIMDDDGDDAIQVAFPLSHLYSFALKPEEHQPSGTCNFSRIDNAVLVQTFGNNTGMPDSLPNGGELRIYAVNYNVLRIMSGMGGLAYSN